MEKKQVTAEEKTGIVFRLIQAWTPRASETMAQVFPKVDWPEDIRHCNMREFLVKVFNDNPKSVMNRGNPSSEAYVQEVEKQFSSKI
jgi:hypothetical protein